MEKGKSDIHASTDEPTGEFTFLSVDQAVGVAKVGGDDAIDFPSADSTKSSLRQLETDIRQMHSKWHNVEQELNAGATRISSLTGELDEKNSRIEKLEEDIQQANIEQRRLTDAVRAADEQRYLTKERDEELQACIREHEANILQKDSTIKAFDEQLVANEAEISSMRSQIEEVTADRDELQAKIALADEKNLESEAESKAMRTQIESLEAELREKRDLLTKEQEDELKACIREHEANILQKDSTIKAFDEQLVANDAEINSLRSQIKEVTANRDELQEKFALADEKSVESETAFQSMRTEIETLEAELSAKRDLIEVLSNGESANRELADTFDKSVVQIVDVDTDGKHPGSSRSTSEHEMLSFHAQHLIVAIDPDGGREIRYPLYKEEMSIGRSREADIQIPNMYISRMHACISCQGSKAIIEDSGSTNGFLVNSKAARRRELTHGDRLNIGTMEFDFIDLSASQ